MIDHIHDQASSVVDRTVPTAGLTFSNDAQKASKEVSDLLFVSMENWDDVWRRNQFLCKGIAERAPQSKILFVGPPRDFSNSVRRARFTSFKDPGTWTVPGFPNIFVTRPPKLLPNSFAWGRCFNDLLARRHITRVARRIGLRNPALWLNPHYAVSMAGRMGERAVIYDVTDDWTAFAGSQRERRLVKQQDAQLCRVADAVIVCSSRLLSMKRELAGSVHLIPNGVDVGHYRSVLNGTGPLPPRATWPKPILGYTGTVHPSRVDVLLLASVAQQMKHGSVVLIGPDHLSVADRARLDALGNVYRTGPIPYDQVPDYMRTFDVSIVPHCVTPFTESLNPIKLWEYLAAGKPIVSTQVAGFRDYPEHVYLAGNVAEFLQAISSALTEPSDKAEARRQEARQHSWNSRVEDVLGVIAFCTEKAQMK